MKYYVTTPIYYVNDQPHIGHAYTSIAADVLAKYNRMRGKEVFFLTGTDEHGQKVQQAAESRGKTPQEHADHMVENFKALWEKLNLTNTGFIRTTDDSHKNIVRELLQSLWDKGEIEKRTYIGMYCTPCERFWTEKDLADGNCPDCGREVESIEEDNYFFLMSKYAERLEEHIEQNPDYVLPETRKNEVLGFLRSNELGDLCISRPKKRLAWGVPLPFDEDFVTYVWFDALINYYSGVRDIDSTEPWWPATVQLIGKDILTTHAVYWSTMLMALELPLPKHIFAHGWWTIEGKKMSKSLGNVVDPVEVVDKYGNDAFRYFLFREVPFGLDGDYSEKALIGRINSDLANDFGNLASRAIKMNDKYFDSKVPEPGHEITEAEHEMKTMAEGILASVDAHLEVLAFQKALDEIWKLVSYTNKYIDSNAPWLLAKDESKHHRLCTVMYNSLEALRMLAVYLHPFMPDATAMLYSSLGHEGNLSNSNMDELAIWGQLKPGAEIGIKEALFPRIDTSDKKKKKEKKVQEEAKKNKQKEETKSDDNLINIKDFIKVEIKTGKITHAEHVEGSNKLVLLKVNTGEDRQVVAGIGKAYTAEELVGKTIVVVTNLKPAKLMGIESQGMLLAATAEDGVPVLLTPEKEVEPGLRIK